jgi:gluconolactonase
VYLSVKFEERNEMIKQRLKGILVIAMLGLGPGVVNVMAQTAPPAQRQTIEDICANGVCVWEKYVTCSGFLEGINFDSEGTLWMVGYLAGNIFKVENGACVNVGEIEGAPNGARFDPAGNFIIADRIGGIQSVNPETGERTVLHTEYNTAQFRGLNDLVFDSEGGYYFTEPYGSSALNKSGNVYYVAPEEDSLPQLFQSGIAYPNGVAVSADGQRVYISEFAENRVLSVPSKLSNNAFEIPFVFARLEGGVGPDGLLVDAEGNLYAAHFQAGEVAIFNAQGLPYGTIQLPAGSGTFTTNLAIHEGYLYVTEASNNDVWRIAISKAAL